jgi:hypothetical protein
MARGGEYGSDQHEPVNYGQSQGLSNEAVPPNLLAPTHAVNDEQAAESRNEVDGAIHCS